MECCQVVFCLQNPYRIRTNSLWIAYPIPHEVVPLILSLIQHQFVSKCFVHWLRSVKQVTKVSESKFHIKIENQQRTHILNFDDFLHPQASGAGKKGTKIFQFPDGATLNGSNMLAEHKVFNKETNKWQTVQALCCCALSPHCINVNMEQRDQQGTVINVGNDINEDNLRSMVYGYGNDSNKPHKAANMHKCSQSNYRYQAPEDMNAKCKLRLLWCPDIHENVIKVFRAADALFSLAEYIAGCANGLTSLLDMEQFSAYYRSLCLMSQKVQLLTLNCCCCLKCSYCVALLDICAFIDSFICLRHWCSERFFYTLNHIQNSR